MKEFLVRLMYVEMLGHDASFGYIKAIELTASQNLAQKKAGYLCSALTLSPEHEFRFMLVNQLQRDLSSSNHLEACAALGALSKLVTVDMIPAIIGDVVKLLRHERELVRKKAVMVLHRLHQLEPDSISHLNDAIRRTLCDKDPSAALCTTDVESSAAAAAAAAVAAAAVAAAAVAAAATPAAAVTAVQMYRQHSAGSTSQGDLLSDGDCFDNGVYTACRLLLELVLLLSYTAEQCVDAAFRLSALADVAVGAVRISVTHSGYCWSPLLACAVLNKRSVMGASLCLLYDLVKADPAPYKDLVPSFVSILKQITEHRLPREYDYHRMPAPWIQMRLLQADQTASEGMYEVLRDVIRRADTGINVGYAVR
eukprot:9270-Heterococcus_DN1.PRE.3